MNKQEKRDFYNGMGNVRKYNPKSKSVNVVDYLDMLYNKTLTMFLYTDLPETLPDEELEKLLQFNGKCWVGELEGDLIALPITYRYDKVDVYNRPLYADAYIPNNKEIKTIKLSDGVVFRNDYLEKGLSKIFEKYSYLITESELTLYLVNLWKRTEKIFTANDDGTVESVREYLSKVEDGELGVIVSNMLFDSLNVKTYGDSGGSIKELIEYDNYIKSQLYSEIGLYSNENMKKERLVVSEIETGLNSIYPLVDNMYNSRIKSIKQLNEKFNLNVNIEFTSSWEYRLNLGENITSEEIVDGD